MFQTLFRPPRKVFGAVILEALKGLKGAVPVSYLHGYVDARVPRLVASNPGWWRERLPQLLEEFEDKGIVKNIVDADEGTWHVAPRVEQKREATRDELK